MRARVLLGLFLAAAAAAPAVAAPPAPEERIAKVLAERVAGPPTDCLIQRDIYSTEIVAQTAILYTMRDGTIYLNRPASGLPFLRRDLALVTDTHSDRLCSIDIVRLYDPVSRFESGSIGLGPFVPYRRPGR